VSLQEDAAAAARRVIDANIGGAEAVYLEAVAEQLHGGGLERGINRYSGRSTEVGGHDWTPSGGIPYRSATPLQGDGDCRLHPRTNKPPRVGDARRVILIQPGGGSL